MEFFKERNEPGDDVRAAVLEALLEGIDKKDIPIPVETAPGDGIDEFLELHQPVGSKLAQIAFKDSKHNDIHIDDVEDIDRKVSLSQTLQDITLPYYQATQLKIPSVAENTKNKGAAMHNWQYQEVVGGQRVNYFFTAIYDRYADANKARTLNVNFSYINKPHRDNTRLSLAFDHNGVRTMQVHYGGSNKSPTLERLLKAANPNVDMNQYFNDKPNDWDISLLGDSIYTEHTFYLRDTSIRTRSKTESNNYTIERVFDSQKNAFVNTQFHDNGSLFKKKEARTTTAAGRDMEPQNMIDFISQILKIIPQKKLEP